MKKGQIYEGCVEYVSFPNKGVLKVEGEKVVVKHTVAGQKISFSISKKRKGKCEGRLLEVLEKSPLEMDSPCPHYGICGGCEFQTLPYEEQLKMKEAQVRALLEPVVRKFRLKELFQVRYIQSIVIRWNIPLEMLTKEVHYPLECIKEAVFMTLWK